MAPIDPRMPVLIGYGQVNHTTTIPEWSPLT